MFTFVAYVISALNLYHRAWVAGLREPFEDGDHFDRKISTEPLFHYRAGELLMSSALYEPLPRCTGVEGLQRPTAGELLSGIESRMLEICDTRAPARNPARCFW